MIIYKPLPENNNITHWELWKNFKHPDENLFFLDIPRNDFVLTPVDIVIARALDYFNKGFYYKNNQCNRHQNLTWQNDFEFYLKFLWLSEEYYFNKLKYPVGAHYNFEIDKIVMHPGTARNLIFNVFEVEKISSIFFNTGGVKYSWLDQSKIVSLEDLEKMYNTEINFVLTADHGSLIPHVHFNKNIIDSSINLIHQRIHQYLEKGNIRSNYNIINTVQFTNSKNCSVEIIFDCKPTPIDIARALMLWTIPMKEIKYKNLSIYKDV